MATREQYYDLLGQMAAIRQQMASQLATDRPDDPSARDVMTNQLADLERQLQVALIDQPGPADGGLGAALGIGTDAALPLGGVTTPITVPSYDDAVATERLYAVGDLYYCYQMERLGMFRAIYKLRELFRAGTLRLGTGPGAFALYRFDRREVLRYTIQERTQAYRRVFGYTDAAPPRGARPNQPFHGLFSQFNRSVANLFRDKRIADTFRPGAGVTEPGFGNIADTRRACLNLRENLKRASYGDVNVLTVEMLQLVASAFDILSADDIRNQFGADNGWDTLEEVLQRYLGEIPVVSQRSRMAENGRGIIQWTAQNFVLTPGRAAFETLIQSIAEMCEEWLTSAEALGSTAGRSHEASADGNILAFPANRHAILGRD